MSKVVRNASKAYGYNYASLADLANNEIDIPKMRTVVDEFGEFVEYLDDDGIWQRGARVVVPEMKGMNAAQAYGSALTYARRHTVQLAKSVATTDDQNIETKAPSRSQSQNDTSLLTKYRDRIKQAETADEVRKICAEAGKYPKIQKIVLPIGQSKVKELEGDK